MSEMKYLMLYEAFESNALSKMMNFLKKKVKNDSKEVFKEKLRTLISELNIPIDKIKDDNVKYLNRNQALKLRSEENESSLYCLKFWFSMDDGYLGFTGTGDLVMDFNEYLGIFNKRRGENKNFNQEELNYIKDKLEIKTGELKPVKDYSELKHGQLVIGIFSDEYSKSRMSLGKIWKDSNHIFVIQNVSEGATPSNGDWREWGRYSWSLGNTEEPSNDHYQLNIYIESDEILQVVSELEVENENLLDFNLPVDSGYTLSRWGKNSWSIDSYKNIEKSDFAIVLMINDIIKSTETKVTDVKISREEARKGATKLISNSEIRDANIRRYILALVGKMGIKTDTKGLQNLQNLVLKSVCHEFAFIAIYRGRPDFENLDSIINNIYHMMRSNKGDKEYYLEYCTQKYVYLKNNSEFYKKAYIKSLKIIENCDNENIKEFFNIVMNIGKKIVEYLLSQNLQSIEDLKMIQIKLESIKSISRNYIFKFEGMIGNIIEEFHYDNDVEAYIQFGIEEDTEELIKQIDKVKYLEKYVVSLLR